MMQTMTDGIALIWDQGLLYFSQRKAEVPPTTFPTPAF